MKKIIKKKGLWGQTITLTIVERLTNVKMGPFEQKKLEEANFHLKKMKSIPK